MKLRINGRAVEASPGASLLQVAQAAGIEIPTLCFDERLQPAGACRLCSVEVRGGTHPVAACHTPAVEGMEVETHPPEIEETRRQVLRWLAANYPADAVEAWPEKPFHRWLKHYETQARPPDGDSCAGANSPIAFQDHSHPYLAADFSRCIHCFRCVRICADVQGQFVWHVTGPGHSARIEPDGPTLGESSCVSCGACADTCPTGALEDQSVIRHGPPTEWTRTTCPYCGVGCELNVGVRADRIVQIKPVLDAPVSKGHLCVKGRYAFDFVHSPERVTEPMIRESGRWRVVSWAEAIGRAAEGFRRIAAESGPDSIGVLGSARGTNEENYLAQKFARVALGTNNIDCCARVCHAPTAAALKQTLGTGAATHSFDDIEQARAFLICGCNPTENHPVVGARIAQAVRRGAKLIVIDPRATELAQRADAHLPLRPGTNVPLLNALAQVIIAEGMADPAAARDHSRAFAAFREFVAAWTPERAAEICGVPASFIRKAARLYALSRPAMCFHGLGVTEHIQGADGVTCLVNLAVLTGNLGKPGAGVNPLRGQNNVQGAAHMGCDPLSLTGAVSLEAGRAAFEAEWGAPLPRTRGLNLMEMVDAAADRQLRALWAIGYDVALTHPNSTVTRAALARLDWVVVQDLFLNELAREFGHVFLPACSSFEKDGTFMNSERRVQRVRRALAPRGNSRPDGQIICDVAKALGAGEAFAFSSAESVWNEVRAVWPAGRGISYARLDRRGLQWPCPDEQHPGTTILPVHGFQGAAFPCVDYEASDEAVTPEFPFLLTTGRTLYQFNAGTMTRRTPNTRLRPADTLDMAPADAQRLGLQSGDSVRVRSRHGEAILPVRCEPRVKPGELFATFHTAEVFLNQLTSPHRDRRVQTPEYKLVAVEVVRA